MERPGYSAGWWLGRFALIFLIGVIITAAAHAYLLSLLFVLLLMVSIVAGLLRLAGDRSSAGRKP
jgi:hypothetical protein